MEIAIAAAGEATKSILPPLERGISYLVHFNRNVQNLKTKIDQLTATRDLVNRLTDAASKNIQVIREPVKLWVERVEIVLVEATQLRDEAELVNNWFKGWCCARFSLGRKAFNKNLIIQALLEERITIGDIVSDPKPIQSLESVFGGDFDAFASRESTRMNIVDALKDGKIGLIGVFGMPGVGKTTLLEAVSDKVKNEGMFDEVIMVTVSQNPDFEKIQNEIAKGLGLSFDDNDNSVTKKAKLNYRIKKGKTLVVLDDVWERLEINKVGLRHKDGNKGCKVVFTTRDRGVCGKMGSDVTIEVTTLTAEESWQLFQKEAAPKNSILPRVASDIAKECKGLPLAIVILGRALREKDENVWNDALELLKQSIYEGMSPVFPFIKMSYDYLGSENTKMCFLFCCLYPEDYKIDIDNIFRYVMGEKLLEKAHTFKLARSIFRSKVDELVSSCLLLRVEEGYVMLHDVVRDVAIKIASESNIFITKAGMNLTGWPDVELDNCNRLSLMSNKITCFPPSQIIAPNLLTLCLNKNFSIVVIPSNFFEGMQNLTTLDLSETGVKSLPSSFSYLRSLCELCMDNCLDLVDISQIDKLDGLEILSLHGCKKIQSWESLGKFTATLKMLDLSIYSFMGFVPSGGRFLPKVIPTLYRLEELRIIGYLRYDDQRDVKLSDIACLTHLTCLHMTLSTDECNTQEVVPSGWKHLADFIFVCHSRDFYTANFEFVIESWNLKKMMFLQLPSISVPNWIIVLSGLTNCLFLECCLHLKSVDQLGMFDNLKFLSIKNCGLMTHVYRTASSSEAKAPMYAFRNLERLKLYELYQLVAFCDGTLPQRFFQNLKSLKAIGCEKVMILIPCDLLERLQNLEKLKVEGATHMDKLVQLTTNATQSMSSSGPSFPIFPKLRKLHISECFKMKYLLPMRVLRELKQLEVLVIWKTNMEMIVEYEDEVVDVDQDKAILPRLKSLDLEGLEKLTSFCPSSLLFDWPALEYLRVLPSWSLKRLPLHTNSAPKLRTLDVRQQWFDRLEWQDESLKSRLQPFVTQRYN